MLRSNEMGWSALFADMLAWKEKIQEIQLKHVIGGLFIVSEETLMIKSPLLSLVKL